VDITTTGRRTGLPRRIEIWFQRVNGRYYLSTLPGTHVEDWIAGSPLVEVVFP
jgi:hypothetical protein